MVSSPVSEADFQQIRGSRRLRGFDEHVRSSVPRLALACTRESSTHRSPVTTIVEVPALNLGGPSRDNYTHGGGFRIPVTGGVVQSALN